MDRSGGRRYSFLFVYVSLKFQIVCALLLTIDKFKLLSLIFASQLYILFILLCFLALMPVDAIVIFFTIYCWGFYYMPGVMCVMMLYY